MGIYAPGFVAELKARGILWFATATSVAEAKAAEAAGADAIIAQGMEAGGHRGAFRAEDAERQMVGLMALLPQVADAVAVPVIAAGGIADHGGNRRGTDTGRERGADRDWVSAIAGSEDTSCLCRATRAY